MKTLKRNLRPFYYCLFASAIAILDEYGYESGEQILTYAHMWHPIEGREVLSIPSDKQVRASVIDEKE